MTGIRNSALPPVRLPDAPVLAVAVRDAVWLSADQTCERLDLAAASRRVAGGAVPIVCNVRATARRLQLPPMTALDVLELFAFVRPARFCVPTPGGLATSLLLTPPDTLEQAAAVLLSVTRALLGELQAGPTEDARGGAWTMARAGWPWATVVLAALGPGEGEPRGHGGLRIWTRLVEWEEQAPLPPPGAWPVEPVEARARLVRLLGARREPRPQQLDYTSHVAAAFAPRQAAGDPRVVLAEAGTGIGKTLGYIAPASVWAQKNKAPVWISTFTRNLQRQLDAELDRLYPDPREKGRRVVVRKGRENLFCLLNFEEAVNRLGLAPGRDAVALGLVARWASATRDGDMVGGDFPAWLADLLGPEFTVDLTDTRGECIYAACRHYRKCFIERAVRRSRRAEIVVANHALVLIQAALRGDDQELPTRYVFDEGHHLLEAADSAFSAHLTGLETAELRRWLLGPEGRRGGRGRGLRERLGDLIDEDREAVEARDEALAAARGLPGPGWRRRLADGTVVGVTEAFLVSVRQQVLARVTEREPAYDIACDLRPPNPELLDVGRRLRTALARIATPLGRLAVRLTDRLDDEAATLETADRQRIEAMLRGLERRALLPLTAWSGMLAALEAETPADFVDWLAVERRDGVIADVGVHRHWRDPTKPLMAALARVAHGLVITSATLCDMTGDDDADWLAAEQRTGVHHLPSPPVLSSVPSPFDYPRLTRVFVVADVDRDDLAQVAAAYRELFLAANGGGLGLFTAISRLRGVHARIAAALDTAGLPLLAQHVDPLDVGTLVDIFRFEEGSCLLGTDAMRDGVDVPGRSLRLIVFDRVPWPRPDILHRARRAVFGGRVYDEMLTRLKLKQAYGRLVRRADDRGVFVMLDRACPSRLLSALPRGVEVHRVGLAEAVAATRAFLSG